MPHFLGPREIGDMDQTVDAGFDFNKNTEVGERLHFTRYAAADRMTFGERLPGVGLGLLESQRNTSIGLVDSKHLDLNEVADIDHLRWVYRALTPRHLGDVYQSLDAFFQLDEGAVVGDTHDFPAEARADRIALGRFAPRIRHNLLHPQ